MQRFATAIREDGLSYTVRQQLWTRGRELLDSAESDQERRRGAHLLTRAKALPAGVELDESLCRRAGIPVEWLEELRGVELKSA